jgi:hypothetical protein
MRNFSGMDFKDLQEAPQENGDTWHVGVQNIDGEAITSISPSAICWSR